METAEFSIPQANIAELADLEDLGLDSPNFLPSAIWLHHLLDGSTPAMEIRGTKGVPQAVVDGEWRERAMSEFQQGGPGRDSGV